MSDPWGTPHDPWNQLPDLWARASDPDDDTPSVPAAFSPNAEMYSYLKVEQLAIHGQGEVWKVERKGALGIFAQKFLLSTASGDGHVKRFHREVRAQSGLVHPGIMPIYAVNFEATPLGT